VLFKVVREGGVELLRNALPSKRKNCEERPLRKKRRERTLGVQGVGSGPGRSSGLCFRVQVTIQKSKLARAKKSKEKKGVRVWFEGERKARSKKGGGHPGHSGSQGSAFKKHESTSRKKQKATEDMRVKKSIRIKKKKLQKLVKIWRELKPGIKRPNNLSTYKLDRHTGGVGGWDGAVR